MAAGRLSVYRQDSQMTDVIYGVPQGSVLGSLLLLIIVNDINYNVNAGVIG